MTPTIPSAFKKAAGCLAGDAYRSELDLVAYFLCDVDAEERQQIATYIDELLSGRYSYEQLQEIWHATPASLYFSDEKGLMWLLREVQRALADFPKFVESEIARVESR